MELLRAAGLACHYGARTIFENVDLVVRAQERIALVGPNGAGKSSLLRQLAGVTAAEGASLVRARDISIGYLAQGVADETRASLQELMDEALARMPDESWAFARKRLRAMLAAFGFSEDDFARPLASFSGGQRSKAALAHLLIDAPDLLILDEPTNHLDIATVRWLEEFIAADSRAYLIVSHDRYFLDRVATVVWELERGRLHAYAPARPAYTAYLQQRAERLSAQADAYRRMQEEREKRRATIAGLRATHTSSDYAQVRSRERQLERVERESAVVEAPVESATINLAIRSDRRATSGFAFEAKGVAKAYAMPLFSDVSVDVAQDDRLAIVGPNGSGKSTLLRILAEESVGDAGTVRYNPAVRRAYFAQNVQDQLDPSVTAVEAVLRLGARTPEEARSHLGRLRITGDEGDREVSTFSGGERRRIVLAGLMAQRPDVLFLDEPTNDLDIASREALESVLESFPGAIVVVSHDRYLLNRLARRVLWIEDGHYGIVESYADYENREREQTAASEPAAAKTTRVTPLKARTNAENRVKRAEREIEKLDLRKAEIDALFADVATYDDRARVKALQDELAQLEVAQAQALHEWEAALAAFEALA